LVKIDTKCNLKGDSMKCKYCKSDKDVWIKGEATNEIYLSKEKITAYCGWCGCMTTVKINYCPMCGRKLEEVLDNASNGDETRVHKSKTNDRNKTNTRD
jgi:uncharacterized FAD-dependent dehydrogenase